MKSKLRYSDFWRLTDELWRHHCGVYITAAGQETETERWRLKEVKAWRLKVNMNYRETLKANWRRSTLCCRWWLVLEHLKDELWRVKIWWEPWIGAMENNAELEKTWIEAVWRWRNWLREGWRNWLREGWRAQLKVRVDIEGMIIWEWIEGGVVAERKFPTAELKRTLCKNPKKSSFSQWSARYL